MLYCNDVIEDEFDDIFDSSTVNLFCNANILFIIQSCIDSINLATMSCDT